MLNTRFPVINALGLLNNPNLQLQERERGLSAPSYAGHGQTVDKRALSDALASGLIAVNITLGHVAGGDDPYGATGHDIADWDVFINDHSQHLRKVLTMADLDAVRAANQVGVIYGFQNTEMLGHKLSRINHFANLGVRVIQLTYNGRNAVGCGATVHDDTGLSEYGVEVVARLQQQRVLVDLSHSSKKTCLDTLAVATKPVAITHSACRAVADHPRNKSDAELRLLADKGGVVGLYFMPYLRLSGQPFAADLIAHLEHAIQVCGEDHVGIGTDGGITSYDDMAAYRAHLQADVELRRSLGIGAPGETADVSLFLPDLSGPTQFQRLAELLAERGHAEARIAKILGANFRRVMAAAWA